MSCLFPGCDNTKHFCKDSEIKFFKFPSLPYMRQKRLSSCNLTESQLPKTPLICSVHFGKNDIIVGNKCKLNKSAFPDNISLPNQILESTNSTVHSETNFSLQNKMLQPNIPTVESVAYLNVVCSRSPERFQCISDWVFDLDASKC